MTKHGPINLDQGRPTIGQEFPNIRGLMAHGMTCAEIARALDMTLNQVAYRAKCMELSFIALRRRPQKLKKGRRKPARNSLTPAQKIDFDACIRFGRMRVPEALAAIGAKQ
jgi:hypothetical protein